MSIRIFNPKKLHLSNSNHLHLNFSSNGLLARRRLLPATKQIQGSALNNINNTEIINSSVAQVVAEFFLYCATSLRSFCFVCVCVINI